MELFEELSGKIKGKGLKIVFPEGSEPRILGAVVRLKADELCHPILLGKKDEIEEVAQRRGFNLHDITVIDPETYENFDAVVESFVERRKGKATPEAARELLKDVNYFGTMLVYTGEVEGLVSGAIHSTGDTVRPALQIIKTKPGTKRTSGAFIMSKEDKRYVFADCAINPTLDAEGLAEIAIESAKTAKSFNVDPKVAMLSFSTLGSAVTEDTTKVAEATKLVKENAPELAVEGELQFDAAVVPSVAKLKAPNSKVQGDANVFVFPSLEAGNIGYKIAQRLGGFEAVGPILQGLNAPVNDLSRGCNVEDVYKLSLITAVQALEK